MFGFIATPSFAALNDSKYEADWRSISGVIDENTPLSCRAAAWQGFYFGDCPQTTGLTDIDPNFFRGDDYQLYGIPDGTTIGIYMKGGSSTAGLCDPVLIIYDVTNPNRGSFVAANDDSGRGGNDGSGYNGWTCDSDQNGGGTFRLQYDSFLAIAWNSNYRIHASTFSYFGEEAYTWDSKLVGYEGGKGAYTLYVSTGSFEPQRYQWQGRVSIECPEANPWTDETLETAKKVDPLNAGGDNIVGQFVSSDTLSNLGKTGVEFSVGDNFVSTATAQLPNYGCSDHLVNIRQNQPIQFIAGGFRLQSEARGYLNTREAIWHDVGGTTLATNTAAFFHVIEFTRPGRYEIVITEAPDTTGLKVPTFGQKSVRFVVLVN
jgi:hypothetical protein